MFCVAEAQDVPRIFQDDVLKAATSPQQRNAALTGHQNSRQRAFHPLVRAARAYPEPLESGQLAQTFAIQLAGANPLWLDSQSKPDCGMRNGRVRGDMRFRLGIEIRDNCYMGCLVCFRIRKPAA